MSKDIKIRIVLISHPFHERHSLISKKIPTRPTISTTANTNILISNYQPTTSICTSTIISSHVISKLGSAVHHALQPSELTCCCALIGRRQSLISFGGKYMALPSVASQKMTAVASENTSFNGCLPTSV